MTLAGADHPADVPPDALRRAGERIEELLDASAAAGAVSRERSEELVRQVTALYGAGLERILRILDEADVLTPVLEDALVADDLVASLLLVHGLHPRGARDRVEAALESVRPYLGTHGGDVELVDVSDEGVVRLRLLGSCDGCPSSSATLELAVESAVEAAAPEVVSIEVVTAVPDTASTSPVIPVSALRARLATDTTPEPRAGRWVAVPEVGALAAGEVGGFAVGGVQLLVCRIGGDVFAFADWCPGCASSLAGARLERWAGQPVGSGVLTCPRCRTHYDVRRAGAAIDADGAHMQPFPVLVRDGVLSVALPIEPEVPEPGLPGTDLPEPGLPEPAVVR
jgi:Fe-S cluster biogenesis protein NfuA/nitrite reductase/ring-hydroxylating ferredoxin subunit